jgi:hypothetical protein
MIDQRIVEEAAVACAVFISLSMKGEGLAPALLWYSIGEDYAQVRTWSEKKAFHALVVCAIAKYTKVSQTFAKKLA